MLENGAVVSEVLFGGVLETAAAGTLFIDMSSIQPSVARDHADAIAAIASSAGATYMEPADCGAASPVHVLAVHGTEDGVVPYSG